jgi:hypothetical protein
MFSFSKLSCLSNLIISHKKSLSLPIAIGI